MTPRLVLSICWLFAVQSGVMAAEPSFRHEVLPILTRYGCNQGACHGKGAGQNGFRLSLRGYAPELDHAWLTREFFGRRIHRGTPEESLLVRKPAGMMPHAGGKLFAADSRAAQTLLAWIKAGAPAVLKDEPRLQKLEILPASVTGKPGDTQQLQVSATLSDGHVEDVTWLAQFVSNDASVLEVTPGGLVTALRPGEAVIRIHFQDQVAVAGFTIPYGHQIDSRQFSERRNVIDEHVMNKLAALHIPPSPICDDATFLRRAMLDTIGTLPTPEEVNQFLADARPDKRAQLVESLLSRPEYVDYWTLQLCDLLQNRKERDHDVRGSKDVRAFHGWLRGQVAANRPWHELARDVLTASGNSVAQPQIGYYVVTIGEFRNAEESDVVAAAAQSFLGTRIGCAKCHNHPLERYTQDDFYHFAGFFARVGFQRTESWKGETTLKVTSEEEQQKLREIDQNEKRIAELIASLTGQPDAEAEKIRQQIDQQTRERGERRKQLEQARTRLITVRQPRTGEQLPPQPLDRSPANIAPGEDPRAALARWMTDPKHDFFAGNMVNRLWRHYFAVGLVEPVDDLRASNPPTNRPLWDALCREFTSHNYDLKHVMRLILNSQVYQLSSTSLAENATERQFYSHYYARRLPAEVLLDAISSSTGVADEFPGYPVGLRAIQVPDASVNSYFLGLFGRSDRVTACACERRGDVTLPQLLHLQCGENLNPKFAAEESQLKVVVRDIVEDAKAAEQIFLLTLSRLPTDADRAACAAALAGAENREEALKDVFWALLNTKEFAFNH